MDGVLTLVTAAQALQDACHSASVKAGWWRDKATGTYIPSDPALLLLHTGWKLTLVHSEVSESAEGFRKGLMDDHLPQYPMAAVEIADAIIRLCDLAGAHDFSLGEVLAAVSYTHLTLPTNREV